MNPERLVLEKLYRLGRTSVLRVYQHISPTGRQFAKVWPDIDSIEGLLVPSQERWLSNRARSLPDGAIVVEIGCYKGRSTACLAYGCQDTNKRIYAIDTFTGNESDFRGPGRDDFFGEWQRNIVKRFGTYVTPVIGDSKVIGKEWTIPINFLFIDGSHVYEDALADFDNFYPHVVRGGQIAIHDVGSHSGPTKVWEERRHLLQKTGRCSTLAFGTKP
jgi:hypothetical protein